MGSLYNAIDFCSRRSSRQIKCANIGRFQEFAQSRCRTRIPAARFRPQESQRTGGEGCVYLGFTGQECVHENVLFSFIISALLVLETTYSSLRDCRLAKKTMARSQQVSGISSLMPEQPSVKHQSFSSETSMIVDDFSISQPYSSSVLMNSLDNSSSQVATKFHERKHPGRVELSYNEHLNIADTGSRDLIHPRCEIIAYPDYLMSGHKYMYDKISERSHVVDTRIKNMEDVVNAEYHFEEEMGNPDQASQFPIKAVGKVMSDSSAKLNDKSIMFETSSRFGAACVHLNVDGISKFSFFPGQILCVEGVNNTGRDVFHAQKLFDLPIPESESTNMRELYDYSHGTKFQNSGPVEIFFAAGPYTTDGGLDYEPLKCLIKTIREASTDLVILV